MIIFHRNWSFRHTRMYSSRRFANLNEEKKTSKIAFFSLNRWWLQERRASRAHLAPAKCALRDGKLRKKENIFFLSTQILCGFLFIFKLLPLSHSRRLRRFPSPRLSRCKTFNSAATTSPSLSPASNSIVKTHEEQQNAGLHERAFHRRRQKKTTTTMKNLRLLLLLLPTKGEFQFDLLSHHVHIALDDGRVELAF